MKVVNLYKQKTSWEREFVQFEEKPKVIEPRTKIIREEIQDRLPSLNKLLVISCTWKKYFPQTKTQALKAYTGIYPSVIKDVFKDKGRPKGLMILIISAKYGLIHENQFIENYNMKMTPERANELKSKVMNTLNTFLEINEGIDEIFFLMPKIYYQSFDMNNLKDRLRVTRIYQVYDGLKDRIMTTFTNAFRNWNVSKQKIQDGSEDEGQFTKTTKTLQKIFS